MDTQNNNLPFKANEVVNILQTAPGILTDNETRVMRCSNAGKSLLDTINATNGINSDEVDGQVQKFIEASKQTLERINGSRKPITQMLTAISKRFTSLESEIDVKTAPEHDLHGSPTATDRTGYSHGAILLRIHHRLDSI